MGKCLNYFSLKLAFQSALCVSGIFQFPTLDPLNLVNGPETHMFDFVDLQPKRSTLAILFLRCFFSVLASCLTPHFGHELPQSRPSGLQVCCSTAISQSLASPMHNPHQTLAAQHSSRKDVVHGCLPGPLEPGLSLGIRPAILGLES